MVGLKISTSMRVYIIYSQWAESFNEFEFPEKAVAKQHGYWIRIILRGTLVPN
jgi:hypothetical protein